MISITPPNRIYAQYSLSDETKTWLNLSHIVGSQIALAADACANSWGIDSNKGAQLDVIARIVGTTRGLADTIELGTYQFNKDGEHEYGDDENQFGYPSVAGDKDLSDEYLRRIIRARIQKNISSCSADDILSALMLISESAQFVRVIDNYDMTVTVEYSGVIDDIAENLINNMDLVPLPACVNIREFKKIGN